MDSLLAEATTPRRIERRLRAVLARLAETAPAATLPKTPSFAPYVWKSAILAMILSGKSEFMRTN
jgi:hypothetical protein